MRRRRRRQKKWNDARGVVEETVLATYDGPSLVNQFPTFRRNVLRDP